jgi:beta-mannosidase
MTVDKLIRKNLNGGWKFSLSSNEKLKRMSVIKDYDRLIKGGIDVTVPGSVLSGLLKNDIIENPYYRENEIDTNKLLDNDYIFETSFALSDIEECLNTSQYDAELVLEGIDTIADIYINDVHIGHTRDMHRRYVFNLGDVLRADDNHIEIRFKSPIEYIDRALNNPDTPEEKKIHFVSTGCMNGNQYIRKAHSMFGWDWGPKLPDTGIWRDIYIRFIRKAEPVLEYVRVQQKHNSDGSVQVSYKLVLEGEQTGIVGSYNYNVREAAAKEFSKRDDYSCRLYNPDGIDITDESFTEDGIFTIKKPEIWWPNGLGNHPLYKLVVSLAGKTIEQKIGLRTIEVKQDKDDYGKEFTLCINGQRVFAKGANYIPEDCVYSNIDKDRQKFILESARDCNFNVIRVWGGGYYPHDSFYDICDELGLMVWQDFMFACNIYDLTEDFKEDIIQEFKDNIRRLRNHPSLSVYCGNNEIESAWNGWGGFKDHSAALKADYVEMFEKILPEVISIESDGIPYHPSSPSSGGTKVGMPDADNIGDRHYWDVWHGEKPFTDYLTHHFRFCSEFGFQSFPDIYSVRTFAANGDMNIFTPVMENHQKNDAANGKILKYISDNFLYPKDFENLLYVSQVLQGLAIKSGVEHFRRERDICTGATYWQINDNWPVASWSSMDYYGRWKALQYYSKHFFKDVMGSIILENDAVVPYVQNETFKKSVTEYELSVIDMEYKVLDSIRGSIVTASFDVNKGESLDISQYLDGGCHYDMNRKVIVRCVFKYEDGSSYTQIMPLNEYKYLELPKATIDMKTQIRNTDGITEIEVRLKSDRPALYVELLSKDCNIIWDDNFFHMVEDREYVIRGHVSDGGFGNASYIRSPFINDNVDISNIVLIVHDLSNSYCV